MIDIDVNDRTPRTPCQTEDCHWPNYHVCLVGKPDLFPQLLGEKYHRDSKTLRYVPTRAHREAMSAAARERWKQTNLQNRERNQSILTLYGEGYSMSHLAREFDVSRDTIRNVLKYAAPDVIQAHGEVLDAARAAAIERDRQHRENMKTSLAEAEEKIRQRDQKIVELYGEGSSMEELAKSFSMGRSTVSALLKRAEKKGLVKVRTRNDSLKAMQDAAFDRNREQVEKISAIYAEGFISMEAIAKDLDLDYKSVWRAVHKGAELGLCVVRPRGRHTKRTA